MAGQEEARQGGVLLPEARQGGVLLPPGVGLPPFLVQLGDLPCSRSRREGKGKDKRRKEGAPPLPLVKFGLSLRGAQPPLSLSPKAQ